MSSIGMLGCFTNEDLQKAILKLQNDKLKALAEAQMDNKE